jgi:hypothetical protein
VSDDDNKDAKNRIQKLVREIDKCIALLNKWYKDKWQRSFP